MQELLWRQEVGYVRLWLFTSKQHRLIDVQYQSDRHSFCMRGTNLNGAGIPRARDLTCNLFLPVVCLFSS